jgi:hypothetical protein
MITSSLTQGGSGGIALLISDVDGTLVAPDKSLTPGAADAVRRLAEARVRFTLVSSRPPRGMAALVAELGVRLPFGAFNGGSLVAPDLSIIEAHRLSPSIARQTLELLVRRNVDAWVFADGQWWLRDRMAPNVALERRTVGFDPTVVGTFDDLIGRIDKIVGVSNDHALLARVESEAQTLIGEKAAIMRSQPYYLDITHPEANKGVAVAALCARIGVDLRHTAVIGDAFNDIAMFARGGFAIAMGQAPEEVKAQADAVTLSNKEDGFARAVDDLVLPRAGRPKT